MDAAERLARVLGWYSLGVGVAKIAAPGVIALLAGARSEEDEHHPAIRVSGLLEIASGVAILGSRRPALGLWGRVLGDVLDLALLGLSALAPATGRARSATVAAAKLGVTALDVMAATRLAGHEGGVAVQTDDEGWIAVARAVTINRPPAEVYRFWRRFDNLPRFMEHLESVEVLDERRSRWTVKAPAGTTVEWEAEIVDDIPDELIAWRSVADASVANSGSVRFMPAPGGRGTEVRVELRYDPPAGPIGAAIATLFGREPDQQVDGDLRRFKQVLETGDVVRSDASVHRGPHPARPSTDAPPPLAAGLPAGLAPVPTIGSMTGAPPDRPARPSAGAASTATSTATSAATTTKTGRTRRPSGGDKGGAR